MSGIGTVSFLGRTAFMEPHTVEEEADDEVASLVASIEKVDDFTGEFPLPSCNSK